jgi:hypothetical protein
LDDCCTIVSIRNMFRLGICFDLEYFDLETTASSPPNMGSVGKISCEYLRVASALTKWLGFMPKLHLFYFPSNYPY